VFELMAFTLMLDDPVPKLTGISAYSEPAPPPDTHSNASCAADSVRTSPTAKLSGVAVPQSGPVWVTVMAVVADFDSDVAVITVVPTATAVTTPLLDTPAIVGTAEDQVIARPLRMLPDASFGVAVSVVVWPTEIEFVGAVIVTDATAAGPAGPPPPPPPEQAASRSATMTAGAGLRRMGR